MTLTHGGDVQGYLDEYGAPPLDFSANLNPLGLPDGVREAVCRAASDAAQYPDPLCRALRRSLAQAEGVDPEEILCGNGAADLIFRIALALKPQKALVLAPTFAEYETALRLVGCEVETFSLHESDAFAVGPALLEQIDGTDIVFLCNPNNPTGRLCEPSLLRELLETCTACGARLVVDECFNDFLDDPNAHTLKPLLRDYPNLLLLKAFTKIYAMAGLRLGYCLCADQSLLSSLRQAAQPWAVSTVAQAAGIAALRETDYVDAVRALVRVERAHLSDGLRALGCKVYPACANYVFFRSDDARLCEKLRARGVLLRSCANYRGLGPGYYRAAVRLHDENRRFLEAVRAALAEG